MGDVIEGEEFAGAFLEHYGVKGMKWGVHRRESSRHEDSTNDGGSRVSNVISKIRDHKKLGTPGGPTDVVVKTAPGKRVQTAGGQNHSPSEDAKRTSAYKQQAKASTIDSLSTKELRDLVDRMNLEQQYSRLNPKQESAGAKFVKKAMPVAMKYGSGMALNAAKSKLGDSSDPKIQIGLKVAEMLVSQMQNNNGGKKKK